MPDRPSARVASWTTLSVLLLGLCSARCSPYAANEAPNTSADTDAAAETGTDAGGLVPGDDASPPPTNATDGGVAVKNTHDDGSFETRLAAAFDGIVEQTIAESASTPIYRNLDDPPLLSREYRCEMVLERAEVHPPSDGFFLQDATNYPEGGTGSVELVGRRAGFSSWTRLATQPFGPSGPVVFDTTPLANRTDFIAFGVRFSSDQPQPGTLQVAEVVLDGYCASPPAEIAWSTGEWSCQGVQCVAALNTGGTTRRSVSCARSTGGVAHEAFCSGEKPVAVDGACELSCPHTLRYIGGREFTYANGSGWLHENRVGPLPSSVAHGATPEAIEGKPCSIPTTTADTYFVGSSCRQENSLYCAFRCE